MIFDTASKLNAAFNTGQFKITRITNYRDTERGEEYGVICEDGRKDKVIAHISSRGVTLLWEEDYESYMSNVY